MTVKPEETMCATCGSAVETDKWHPVATKTTEAGDMLVHSFCCEACREEWMQAEEMSGNQPDMTAD